MLKELLNGEQALKDSTAQLRMIGVNVNQIARRMNKFDPKHVTDGKNIRRLIKFLLGETDKINGIIAKHSKIVWSLIYASRHRYDHKRQGR